MSSSYSPPTLKWKTYEVLIPKKDRVSSSIHVYSPNETTVILVHREKLNVWVNDSQAYDGYSKHNDSWVTKENKTIAKWSNGSQLDNYIDWYDFSKMPYIETVVKLRKGNNRIRCTLPWNSRKFGDPWQKIAYLKNLPDGCFYGATSGQPVNFIAMVNPKDNYYTIERTGYKLTLFTGRGTKTFTPQGKRATVILVGASVASRGNRPTSSETTITGNGINYSSNGYATGLSIANNQAYIQSFTGAHGSHKYQEQSPLSFWWDSFNFGDPSSGINTMTGTKEIMLPAYISGSTQVSLFNARIGQANRLGATKVPLFTISGEGITTGSRKRINTNGNTLYAAVSCFGGATPVAFNTTDYWNQGGYSRSCRYNIHWGMGLSKPTQYSFTIPTNKPNYAINIGTCPDIWGGKVYTIPSGGTDGNGTITCVNTTPFDGAAIILEEL